MFSTMITSSNISMLSCQLDSCIGNTINQPLPCLALHSQARPMQDIGGGEGETFSSLYLYTSPPAYESTKAIHNLSAKTKSVFIASPKDHASTYCNKAREAFDALKSLFRFAVLKSVFTSIAPESLVPCDRRAMVNGVTCLNY